jgi:hypothetical protein
MTIAERIRTIKQQIAALATQHGRDTHSVMLLAVSKQQSAAKINEAYQAGQQAFGENYLQEALQKMEALANLAIEWHFIGHIQANKTRKIAEHFSFVQSVSSLKIAERLNAQRPDHLPPLNICIEINIQNEHGKSGISPSDVKTLVKDVHALPKLKLRGLMAIPAASNSPAEARAAFRNMKTLFDALRHDGYPLDMLSMGMSQDFAEAIAEGSTLVRIGTAIFGERS